ncbi:popeye domain-containing protein 1-like, partial [Saccoglossus kowalevskii]
LLENLCYHSMSTVTAMSALSIAANLYKHGYVSIGPMTPSSPDNEPESGDICGEWLNPQHILFQLGHVSLAVSLLIPKLFRQHALVLRIGLTVAFLFLLIWAATISCMPDIFGWTFAIFIINIVQIGRILYALWPVVVRKEVEDVYITLFQPLRVSRKAFNELTETCTLSTLKKGELYAEEFKTEADKRLSILLAGRVSVACEDTYLHTITCNEFLDTPEWESCKTGSVIDFSVTLSAVEDCNYLSWQRKDLECYLKKTTSIKGIFDSIIGKDISKKLFAMNEYALSLDGDNENVKCMDDGMNVTSDSQPTQKPHPPATRGNSGVSQI